MANVQKQFDDFHSGIQLSNDDEKAKLQDKRNMLVKNLKAGSVQHAKIGRGG